MECDPDIKTKLLTAGGLVTDKPCWLYSVIAVGDGSATNVFNMRDGELTTSVSKMVLSCAGCDSVSVIFVEPVRFNNGLYGTFDISGLALFVQYKPDY